MSIDFATLKPALYDWIVAVTGISAIWLNEDGPKPDLPYITMLIGNINSNGEDELLGPDETGTAAIKGHRECDVYFQAYGDNAINNLEKLYISMTNPVIRYDIKQTGWNFVQRLSPATDISGLNDTRFEERASMDLQFRVVSITQNVDTGVILKTNIDTEYKNPDSTGQIIIDTTI